MFLAWKRKRRIDTQIYNDLGRFSRSVLRSSFAFPRKLFTIIHLQFVRRIFQFHIGIIDHFFRIKCCSVLYSVQWLLEWYPLFPDYSCMRVPDNLYMLPFPFTIFSCIKYNSVAFLTRMRNTFAEEYDMVTFP